MNNLLHGPNGCVQTFAWQKGATEIQIPQLEKLLWELQMKFQASSDSVWSNVDKIIGSGASGGIVAGMSIFVDKIQVKPGIELISDLTHLEEWIKSSDLVITGEGKVDATSFDGKVVGHVLKTSLLHKKKILVIAG